MLIYTESGSVYEYAPERKAIRRTHVGDEDGSHKLRRDGEWVPLWEGTITATHELDPRVGEGMMMYLDIRKDGIPTLRTTTRVTMIEEDSDEGVV